MRVIDTLALHRLVREFEWEITTDHCTEAARHRFIGAVRMLYWIDVLTEEEANFWLTSDDEWCL